MAGFRVNAAAPPQAARRRNSALTPYGVIVPYGLICSSITFLSPTTTIVALSSWMYFCAIRWTSAGDTAYRRRT